MADPEQFDYGSKRNGEDALMDRRIPLWAVSLVINFMLAIFYYLLVMTTSLAAQTEAARSSSVLRAFQRSHPCPSTGMPHGACPGYIKDHIIALCDGGPDAVSNLQWQTTAAARAKDRTECHHRPGEYHG